MINATTSSAPTSARALATNLPEAVAAFAARLHAAAEGSHHVASPLGAWLLIALCARRATAEHDELSQILAADADTAARWAAELLGTPHQAIASALGIWTNEQLQAEGLASFLASLPPSVERDGRIPSKSELDTWTRTHTFGLIDSFPAAPTAETSLLIASALAVKVAWAVPFHTTAASELGAASEWSRRLTRVLRIGDEEHHAQLIVRTTAAGDVAVHSVWSADGVMVTSVIARPEVPPRDVMAAAYEVAIRLARSSLPQLSLFDLSLGESAIWKLEEQEVATMRPGDCVERYTTVIPAWEARSDHDLYGARLGFEQAGAAIARLANVARVIVHARQSALARYTRTGFEAAAATAADLVFLDRDEPRSAVGIQRHATLRFAHPYAVVAVTRDTNRECWHGVPVFSAWIATPNDAEEEVVRRSKLLEQRREEVKRIYAERARERARERTLVGRLRKMLRRLLGIS